MEAEISEMCRSVVGDPDWKIAVVQSGQQPDVSLVFVERYDKTAPHAIADRIRIGVHRPTWQRWSETERRSFFESQWLELREFHSTNEQREMMAISGNNSQGAA